MWVRDMFFHMRTTLDLPDDVMVAAKKLAADEGQTLTQIVTEALRDRLRVARRPPPEFEMLVVEGGGAPAVDITDRDALYDFMEKDG